MGALHLTPLSSAGVARIKVSHPPMADDLPPLPVTLDMFLGVGCQGAEREDEVVSRPIFVVESEKPFQESRKIKHNVGDYDNVMLEILRTHFME